MSSKPNISVNLNKVALLRNSRGGDAPNLAEAAALVVAQGADGLTVHPREDERHVTPDDVVTLSQMDAVRTGAVEYNIEGDMRAGLVDLIETVMPTQYTVVPVRPGEITSDRGWRAHDDHERLHSIAKKLQPRIRISVFCDPDKGSVDLAARAGVDAVEFYTGIYARQEVGSADAERAIEDIAAAAAHARSLGLRIHGGHDLTLENLPPLLQAVDFDELSIGHHIASTALLRGLGSTVHDYLACVKR